MGRNFFNRKISFFLILMVLVSTIQAQVDVKEDREGLPKDKKTEVKHSPKKATIYSAILPGLGQAYNKKYWKIPLIYIGFGVIGYFIDWNNGYYQLNRKAYIDLTDDDDNTNSFLKLEAAKYYDLNNQTSFNNFKDGLLKRQDYYQRNRDLLIISMVGFYGLNLIDASVDANLFDFDISDDLSLKWQPTMMNFDNKMMYCINVNLNF